MAAPVPALQRAKRILDLMARDPQRRFRAAEVARELDLHRASCFSLLVAMTELGLVQRHEAGPTYSLGPALLQLAERAGASYAGFPEARQEMFRLARELNVGCLVSARAGFEMIILDCVGVDDGFFPGRRSPLRAPTGTVYLAWSSMSEIRDWIKRSGLSDSEGQAVIRAAAAIRARGYSVDSDVELGLSLERMLRQLSAEHRGQAVDETLLELASLVRRSTAAATADQDGRNGVRYIIAPIFDRNHQVVMTLTLIAGPSTFPPEQVDGLASKVVEASNRVTAALRAGTR